MKIFEQLNRIRAYQRENMSYLKSLEDYDILCAIGHAQETNTSCSPRQLVDSRFGSPATVRRRLYRLIKLGVVLRRAHIDDSRRSVLLLSANTVKSHAKLQDFLKSLRK